MKAIRMGMILAVAAAMLLGCSGRLREDITAPQALAHMLEEQGVTDYHTADREVYSLYFEEAAAPLLPENACIAFVGEGVEQLAVFRAPRGESVAALRDRVQHYLEEQRGYLRSFAANYRPEDLRIIDRARVETVGSYVVLTMLEGDRGAHCLQALQRLLEQA